MSEPEATSGICNPAINYYTDNQSDKDCYCIGGGPLVAREITSPLAISEVYLCLADNPNSSKRLPDPAPDCTGWSQPTVCDFAPAIAACSIEGESTKTFVSECVAACKTALETYNTCAKAQVSVGDLAAWYSVIGLTGLYDLCSLQEIDTGSDATTVAAASTTAASTTVASSSTAGDGAPASNTDSAQALAFSVPLALAAVVAQNF